MNKKLIKLRTIIFNQIDLVEIKLGRFPKPKKKDNNILLSDGVWKDNAIWSDKLTWKM